MAITVKDGSLAIQTVKTTVVSSEHIGHQNIDSLPSAFTADTAAIKTAVQLIDNAVSGNEIQVDVVAALPAGTNNIGDVDIATIAAGETHIGEVGGSSSVVSLTFSLDTSAYASGDVLAETQELASAVRVNAGTGILYSIILNDKDDQGAALDLVFLSANTSLGTENSAVSISDSGADDILGIVSIAATDWIDLGGTRVATKNNVGLTVKGVTGSTSIYVGAITRGTPTHTGSGITARFGILRD